MNAIQLLTWVLIGVAVLAAAGSVYFAIQTAKYRRRAEEAMRQAQRNLRSLQETSRRWPR